MTVLSEGHYGFGTCSFPGEPHLSDTQVEYNAAMARYLRPGAVPKPIKVAAAGRRDLTDVVWPTVPVCDEHAAVLRAMPGIGG